MATAIRQRDKPASLSVLVLHAERQLLDRRQLVRVRAATLGQDLHSALTSPTMLLVAGGLGFVAGIVGRRPALAPGNGKRPSTSRPDFFGRSLKLIRTVLAILPLANHYFHPENAPE